MNAATIAIEALSLPVQQRPKLATQLLPRLDAPSESGIEPHWFEEAAHRTADRDQGLFKRIPVGDVRRQANVLPK